MAVPYAVTAVAVAVDGKQIAVGGDDKLIHHFTLDADGNLTDSKMQLDGNRGAITALAYSPDGKWLAAADTDRKVMVYATANGTLAIEQWCFHSAKVNCLAWSPDSLHAVSGGLDRDVYVWSVATPTKFVQIKGAHQEGVSGVAFLDDATVVSVGADACVKTWKVTYHG